MVIQEPDTKTITDTRKRPRAFAITSLSLGLLSVYSYENLGGTVDFGGGVLTSSAGSFDIFVIKLKQ